MGLASDLRAAVAAVNETDQKLARLVGQHIDDTAKGLRELKDISTKEEAAETYQLIGTALGPASFDELNALTEVQLQNLKRGEPAEALEPVQVREPLELAEVQRQ